ncbi:MAG TPA: hypothetical protein VGO95_12725, partial [Modestobacter sp.]|nr:hypothetical protein [Modestobacter sp.]
LRHAINGVEATLTFAASSLSEHAESVVQKARADLEAMVAQEVSRLGLEPSETRLLELPTLAGEDASAT